MPYNDYLRRKYELEQAQAAQEQPEQPNEQDRAHLFTAAAGVLLPMAQAIITGALFGAAAWFYAWLLRSPKAWQWGAGVGLGVAVLSWLLLLFKWSDLTQPLERFLQRDINQDGYIGPPPTVRIEVKREDGRQIQFAEIPTTKEKLIDFARAVALENQPISESRWSGAGALFSKDEFRAVRAELLARGWLRWKNPDFHDQGAELSPAGRAILKQYANES